MLVNHSGWNQKYGPFSYDVFIDENKQDYELHFSDGSKAFQRGPFQSVTGDWNYDGDVYTQFGAWFSDDKGGYRGFWTPEQMVRELVDAMDPDCRQSGTHIVNIPGVTIPPKEKRPRLDDRIRQTENRAMYQEIEKNRKMNALGIRPPGEPWAR